jgi:hypothetical protein
VHLSDAIRALHPPSPLLAEEMAAQRGDSSLDLYISFTVTYRERLEVDESEGWKGLRREAIFLGIQLHKQLKSKLGGKKRRNYSAYAFSLSSHLLILGAARIESRGYGLHIIDIDNPAKCHLAWSPNSFDN